MPTTPPLTAPRSLMRKWRRRKELWDRTYSVLFRAIQEEELPQPVEGEVPARTWEQAHGQPIDGAMTGAPTPDDEYSEAKAIVRKGVVKLRGRFPQLMPGLPQIPAEPEALMDQVWSKAHQRAFGERPRLPGVLREGLDLGKLATMGPFSTHVSREGDTYQIDLSLYQGLPHQDGLRHLATRTILRQEGELLQATEIECIAEGTRFRPGDEGWTEASRLVACGLYTHATIVKHLAVCHVFVNASFSVAARNTLPAAHPLMALLWPHLHGNLDVNNTLGPALVDERHGEGVFRDIFNLTAPGVWQLMAQGGQRFSLDRMDPTRDIAARGLDGVQGLHTPTTDDAVVLWEVIHRYTRAYVDASWESDAALAEDLPVTRFLSQLAELVPNGIASVIDPASPTRAALARLVALLIYTASVEHELVGNLTWNFGAWAMYVPTRVYQGGGLPAVDTYQRFFNVLFATNVPARKLMSDNSHIAPGEPQAQAMRQLHGALRALNEAMLAEGPKRMIRLYPEDLEACVAV